MQLTFKMFLPLMIGAAFNLTAADQIEDKATGEKFPSEVSFSHDGKDYTLEATGVATRKKLIVKVYSVASYLQKDAEGGDIFQQILSDNNAKQLTVKWVRGVDLEKFQEGYKESFHKAFGNLQPNVENNIRKYLGFFDKGPEKGDEHVIRWLPGGYVEVLINGNEAGNITDEAFAKGLWSIWFGSSSVVNKNDLVSLAK